MEKRVILIVFFSVSVIFAASCAVPSENCVIGDVVLQKFESDRIKTKEKFPFFWAAYGKDGFASNLSCMLSALLQSLGEKHADERILCVFIRDASMSCPNPKALLLTEKHLYVFSFGDAFSLPKYGLKKIRFAKTNNADLDEFSEITKKYSKEIGGWDDWIASDQPLAYFVFRMSVNDVFHGFFYEYHGMEKNRYLSLNLFVEKMFQNFDD